MLEVNILQFVASAFRKLGLGFISLICWRMYLCYLSFLLSSKIQNFRRTEYHNIILPLSEGFIVLKVNLQSDKFKAPFLTTLEEKRKNIEFCKIKSQIIITICSNTKEQKYHQI
jgi:hypothetical protein